MRHTYSSNFKTDKKPGPLKYFARFKQQIEAAPFETDPCPYIVFPSVFEPEHYDQIRGSLFDTGNMESFSESYQNRSVVRLNQKTDWESSNDPRERFWFELMLELSGPELNQVLFKKFEPFLSLNPMATDVITRKQGLTLVSKSLLVRDAPSYSLGPHRDYIDKFLTVLFYLPESDNLGLRGTSFFAPKNAEEVFADEDHYTFQQFTFLHEVDFSPNSALVFFKTPNSFHGVLPSHLAQGNRDLLIHNVHMFDSDYLEEYLSERAAAR